MYNGSPSVTSADLPHLCLATACDLFLVFGVSGVMRGTVLGVFGVVPEEWPSCGGRGLLGADPEVLVFLKEWILVQFYWRISEF